MPATRKVLARGTLVYLRRPLRRDAGPFLSAVESSRKLHRLWVQAPSTPSRFADYVRRFSGPSSRDLKRATHVGLLVCRREDDAPVGVFNFSEIVRGAFESSYLGYYAFAPHVGQGYMSEGLNLVLALAFAPQHAAPHATAAGVAQTSTTIPAPVKASASPLSVMVFTPNEGEASNTLQLSWRRL